MKNVLYLSILSVIVVASLIGFNIYHNFTTSTITENTGIKIIQIAPSFDKDILKMLKKRQVVSANLSKRILQTPKENSSPSASLNKELFNVVNQEASPSPTRAFQPL